jgi:single-stranded DNA-binding protein
LYHHLPLIGVKGRIQSEVVEKDGSKKYYMNVIAERVTFLTNNNQKKVEAIKNVKITNY